MFYPHVDTEDAQERLCIDLGATSALEEANECRFSVDTIGCARCALDSIRIESCRSYCYRRAKLYKLLAGGLGVPKLGWLGVEGDYNVMVPRAVFMSLGGECRYLQSVNGSFSAVSKPILQATTHWSSFDKI